MQGFAYGGDVTFADFSSAGDAVFVINPGHGSNGGEGTMLFTDNATAANGIFTLNGPVGKFADMGPTSLSSTAPRQVTAFSR